MKKFLAVFISVLILICGAAFGFAGCSDGKNPSDGDDDDNSTVTPPDINPPNPPDDTDGDAFCVSLIYNNKPFVPETPLKAVWTDLTDGGVYTADFNDEGKASITGLDGDYQVTLNDGLEGYTYDSNIYRATNDQKSVSVTLYRLTVPTITPNADGSAPLSAIRIRRLSAYRARLVADGKYVYYMYEPQGSGVYSIWSMLNVTANEVNPILDAYYGSKQYVSDKVTVIDDGGSSSTYTKNFKYEVHINEDELNGVFIFGIKAESRVENAFPIDVDFMITYESDYVREDPDYEMVIPRTNFVQTPEISGNWTYFASLSENNVLDGNLVKFNEADGYYHLYDKETGAFGATLYAKVSEPCAILEESFTTVEYVGNKALSIFYKGKYLNYKLFIEGYDSLHAHEYITAELYADASLYYSDGRTGPVKGYRDYCNSDGVYPVTEELKEFLQGYAVNQRMFNDGNGWAENHGYNSSEENQWLFACGVYA